MQKKPLDRYDLAAALLILAGTTLRFVFIALGWPAAYNDEGTLGLMARHILYNGAHPLVYYGQDYMGSLEAYLGAGFFFFFGPSTFALRLGLLLLFALALICMYLLVRLLYSKPFALLTLVLLVPGSPEVVFRQLMATGGDPDYFFFTALLLLVTAQLVLNVKPFGQGEQQYELDYKKYIETGTPRLVSARLVGYGLWGGIAGLALWSHPLCIPFVGCAALFLLVLCRKDMRVSTLSLVLLCFLLGLSPLLIYKVTVPVSPRESSIFSGAFGGGYREPSYPAYPGMPKTTATIAPKAIQPLPLQQLAGSIFVAIPVATNGMALCPLPENDAWPLSDASTTYTRFCTGVHGIWGIGFLLLWFIATFTTIRTIRGLRQFVTKQEDMAKSTEARREIARHATRLLILVGAGSTLFIFILDPQAAAITPWNSARYLVGLLIVLPCILFPLWELRKNVKLSTQPSRNASLRTLLVSGLLFLFVLTPLLGTLNIFTQQVTRSQAGFRQQQHLIDYLVQRGNTRIYMDYDDCGRIAFLSNERIVCAALDKGLGPGLDRYYPYRALVAQAAKPCYVLLSGSVQAFLFEKKAREQHIAYAQTRIDDYIIYEPERRVTPVDTA